MRRNKDHYTIFLVDDEPSVLKALSGTLSEQLDCDVCCFEDALICLKRLETADCDLLITDMNMPGMSGLDLLKEVRQIRPQLAVVMITGYADVPMAVRAVKAGARDFLEKPLDEDSFLSLIQKILKTRAEDRLLAKAFTDTEIEILAEIAAGRSNKQIALHTGRSTRTIENHRYRIMRKLGVDSVAELIKSAIEMGLVNR
jgi:two-component system response regulator TtrR